MILFKDFESRLAMLLWLPLPGIEESLSENIKLGVWDERLAPGKP